jgi:glycosyltransferase involved in cell wall biosynthesis
MGDGSSSIQLKRAMKQLPITVSMISGAEASRIGRALESVAGWTSEIIVVLNEDVKDDTEAIARRFGARVFLEPWKGYVAQKASAAEKATQEWVLGLDADEVVSPELRAELESLFTGKPGAPAFAACSFARLTMFCGRWIRHGDWYPDRTTRLWRKNLAEWGGVDPHAKLLIQGEVQKLRGDLLHYNAESIDRQIAKISGFSSDFVRHQQATGRRATWPDLVLRPAWRFVRSYFIRLGFLDGWQGWYIAWMTAFQTATRYAKVREAQAEPVQR